MKVRHRHTQMDTVNAHARKHTCTGMLQLSMQCSIHTLTYVCVCVHTSVHSNTEAQTYRNTHLCRYMKLTSFRIHLQRPADT